MFNKVLIVPQTNTNYVPYCETVTEVKAPTDENIRLYEEIKQKAYNSILKTIDLKDNVFNVVAVVFKDNLEGRTVCRYTFTLNGHEIKGEERLDDFSLDNTEDVINKIIDGASKRIASTLTRLIYKDCVR